MTDLTKQILTLLGILVTLTVLAALVIFQVTL